MSQPAIESDTPLSKGRAKPNSYHTRALGTAEEGHGHLSQYRAHLADDMAHAAVLADKQTFCDAYFPIPSDPTPNKPKPVLHESPFVKLAQLPKFKGNEAKIQEEFVNAVNDHNLIPGLVLRVCGDRPYGIHMDPTQQKVDTAWYFEHEVKDTKHQEWGNQVIPVEFKGDETGDDPYDDKEENISTGAKSRKNACGQMTTHAEILHAVQQRTALFMLIVTRKRARFTRWDRSGTVVTQSFNYIDEWRFFCDVLWRIGHCSRTHLGLDPTATRLFEGDADWQRMRTVLEEKEYVDHTQRVLEDGKVPEGEFKYVRDMFHRSLAKGWPRYRVEVPVEVPADETSGAGAKKIRHFLIAKPTFCAKGMAGRGTRGYVALDCETEKFVWLKDAWRANYEFVRKEGDILTGLNQAEVSNIPTMLCHGDIEGQTTETPNWWAPHKPKNKDKKNKNKTPASDATRSSVTYVDPSTSSHLKRKLDDDDEPSAEPATGTQGSPLRLHQHYRLVVEEVAMPLDCFEYPRQLIQIVFDCVVAHYEASTKPEPNKCLLHRDISSGNILIYPRVLTNEEGVVYVQWRGLLADWEMSKPQHKGDGQRRPRQPERTGTWQYTSVALLGPGAKFVILADELESFFHVLLYYAVRYVKSLNCDGEAIAQFLDEYFDVYGYQNGMYTCSALKTSTITKGKITVGTEKLRFGNPLDALFSKVLSWFAARYIIAEHDKESPGNTKLPAPSAKGVDVLRSIEGNNNTFLAQFGGPEESDQKPEEGPTPAQKALAERLKSHKGLARALDTALRSDWPDEKTEDQIPETRKPSAEFPHPPSRNVKNKRQRTRKARAAQSEPLFLVTAGRPPKTPPPKRAIRSVDLIVEDEGEDGESSSESESRSDLDSDYLDESESE
ncbi:hypothetical protein GSI_05153 [Ganoderma sinense ZZ0214-1]|uniref:Fungal-type protein kinase domain-containing protein n=1 Tax=Ganoderma sinense ZZ0214-1 TaxID=1077348 RepID=A0A2G8SFD4_9APHY|nr:hypothetical protein GSI_05153 [Ganoderma sinense ZZ0214-1]